mmetsp:Transcript_9327/g.34919  ORF Transcript_9327/g.34919 Transcript_9327/m.34919 type:complete len:242 (-) Transcript_9327:2654-3379(-)
MRPHWRQVDWKPQPPLRLAQLWMPRGRRRDEREHAGAAQSQHHLRVLQAHRLHDERGPDRPRLEQVRMVAHLSELHQHIHHPHEVAPRQRCSRAASGEEILVKELLSPAKVAVHEVLELLRQLLCNILLQPPQEKRAHDGVEPPDQSSIDAAVVLDHVVQRVAEPVAELGPVREDVGHQKMHQSPKLHQRVLQGRASQQESPLRVEADQRVPPLALEVLDVVGLVQDEVVPLLPPKAAGVF